MGTKRAQGLSGSLHGIFTILLMVASPPASAGQVLETYRARHRPARELVVLAEAALGDQGRVTLDARTATLILNGTEAAVRRALRLLEQMDRALHQLVLTYEVLRLSELKQMGAHVQWKVTSGSVRMGTLPRPIGELHVASTARRESTRRRIRSSLRLLEGSAGLIVTGEALPFVYQDYWGGRGVDFIPAETGFEVEARVLGGGKVQLELRPFSGRFKEGGALRYTQARTSITLSAGETVVLGEVSSQSRENDVGLQGARTTSTGEREVLLFSIEMDKP